MKKTLAILLLAGATFLTGCGDSFNDDGFVVTNSGLVIAPVCVDDAYTVNSNTTLTVNAANGVLANDTPNGASLTFDVLSANNGTIVGAADGSFTYTPAANFTGQDTFTYTLANNGGQRTCTVTITVNAVNGFFVDATNGSDTTGSFNGGSPFATIQAAAAAAPAGSDIVVRAGNYTGTVTLENGDRLLGEGSVLAQGAAVRPVLTGPVVLGDGCTVDFVRIDGTASDAIDGMGQNGGTVTNCEVANTTGGTSSGVDCQNSSGTWVVEDNTFTNLGGAATNFTVTNSDVLSVTISDNTMSNNGLSGVILTSEDSSNVTAFVIGNTFNGNNTVTGNAFELQCLDSSTFCLDLEDNTNDDVYVLFDSTAVTSNLSVEQFASNGLTTPKPSGAGNTGSINALGDTPTSVADGFCSQP